MFHYSTWKLLHSSAAHFPKAGSIKHISRLIVIDGQRKHLSVDCSLQTTPYFYRQYNHNNNNRNRNNLPYSTMSPSIPEKQWAQVFEKKGGPIEYKEIPVPKPGPDEVLVNIKFSGVCHTDLHVGFLLR